MLLLKTLCVKCCVYLWKNLGVGGTPTRVFCCDQFQFKMLKLKSSLFLENTKRRQKNKNRLMKQKEDRGKAEASGVCSLCQGPSAF